MSKLIRFIRLAKLGNRLIALQLILVTLSLILINYLAYQNSFTLDISKNKDYTLSKISQQSLRLPALINRDNPVKIIVAYRKNSYFRKRLELLTKTYQRASKDKIKIIYVNPNQNPNKANQLENDYGIKFVQDWIIIDANSDPKEKKPEHIRFLTENDLLIFSNDPKTKQNYAIAYQDEDVITSNLVSALEGTSKKIYLLTDKSHFTPNRKPQLWEQLARSLQAKNFVLYPLRLSSNQKSLPKDASVIMLIAPQYDLSLEELNLLTKYWKSSQSSLFITLNPKKNHPHLNSFLRKNGIRPEKKIIISHKRNEIKTEVTASFLPEIDLNKAFIGKSTLFEGISSNLIIEENNSTFQQDYIHPFPLIKADSHYWAESKFTEEKPKYDKEEDTLSPLYLAGAVVLGDLNSHSGNKFASKLIVFSNSHFIESQKLRVEQLDYLLSCIDWLSGRETLIGINQRKIKLHQIDWSAEKFSTINRYNLIIFPTIFLIIGSLIWSARHQ